MGEIHQEHVPVSQTTHKAALLKGNNDDNEIREPWVTLFKLHFYVGRRLAASDTASARSQVRAPLVTEERELIYSFGGNSFKNFKSFEAPLSDS